MSEPSPLHANPAPTGPADESGPGHGGGDAFERALSALAEAPGFAKPRYQTEVFRLASEALSSDQGVARLRRAAARFDTAGVFHGGPWERVDRLLPRLVGGGLLGEGMYPTVEALSELRVLAIAAGETSCERVTPEEAQGFLQEVMGFNLQLLYGEGETEDARLRPQVYARARRVLSLIREEVPSEGLAESVLLEIEQRTSQRALLVDTVRDLIRQAVRIPGSLPAASQARLEQFVRAVDLPTDRARAAGSLVAYREQLLKLDDEALASEASEHGALLRSTGLSNEYHAVLLRRVRRSPAVLAQALGLSEVGLAQLNQNAQLVSQLIACAIYPATRDAIYGLSEVFERTLLSRPEVAGGLVKLIDLDLRSEARQLFLAGLPPGSGVTANGVLVAGALAMLGQPLGVGQGANPTCVAARALSLWSLHAPGYLLELIVSACRDGTIEIPFEGRNVSSHQLAGGLAAAGVDPKSLDPISRALVPHLDRIYSEMMRLAANRGEDAHKWVNPALYGRWVPNGFASVFDLTGTAVAGYTDFIRLFYATHHPAYVDQAQWAYPNPVGITVTDVHGNLLGYHAVSIQRVSPDPAEQLRVYFYNPNAEGRQRWGRDVGPTVYGHGEVPGESSLPFDHFAAHLYAFHYNPYEVGDGFAVPEETVEWVTDHARSTWGQEFTWL